MAESSEQKQGTERKRLTPSEIEERVNELYEWMQHMKRINLQHVMPHTTGPLIDSEGRADLNRFPAMADPRRRD